jgi:hypothetical protein
MNSAVPPSGSKAPSSTVKETSTGRASRWNSVVINRARYQQHGFFLHPRFKSVFSDDYFSWAAYKDGIVIDANHIVIEHHHPFFNEGKGWDEVYAIHNSPERYQEGAAIFEELTGRAPRGMTKPE